MCNLQHLVRSTMSCNHHLIWFHNMFITPQKENPFICDIPALFFPAPAIDNHQSGFFMNLPVLDSSYKWNYTTCNLLCQASFTQLNIFFDIHLLVVLSIILNSFMAVCICHILFTNLLLMDIWVASIWVFMNSAA